MKRRKPLLGADKMAKPNKLASLTRENLSFLYFDKQLTQKEIAEKFGVHQGAIFYWMRKYKLFARDYKNIIRREKLRKGFLLDKNPRWNGGRTYNAQRYVLVKAPGHQSFRRTRRGYIFEHIYVWEKHFKKSLPKEWEIHHLNGVKDDNTIENLVALPPREHRYLIASYQEEILRLQKENKKLKEELKNVYAIA